jgi:hypothetical protein
MGMYLPFKKSFFDSQLRFVSGKVIHPALRETIAAGWLFPDGKILSLENCMFAVRKIAPSYRNVTQDGQNVTRFDGGAVERVVE